MLARQYLDSYFALRKKLDNLKIDTWDFRLVSLHRQIGSDIWYYKVELQPYHDLSFNHPLVGVFVTMSGHVSPLEPTSLWKGDE